MSYDEFQNPFILGSKNSRSRSRVTKKQRWSESLHCFECWLLLIKSMFNDVKIHMTIYSSPLLFNKFEFEFKVLNIITSKHSNKPINSWQKLNGKYTERVQIPAKAIADFYRYIALPFADMIQRASVKCRQSPVYEFLTVTSTSLYRS